MSRFLNEFDANRLLSSYEIPMAKSFQCKTIEEVGYYSQKMEFPIVMKVLSPDILHKTDAGCVFVGVNNEMEAREIFNKIIDNARKYNPDACIDGILIQEMTESGLEIIIGVKTDLQFGPVIMVGFGGIYVEIFRDISLRLLPITEYDTEEMIKETKIYEVIKGARGLSYDMDKLIDVLLKISKLVEENNSIEQIEINPFFLYEKGKGGKGVDALIKIKT